jgi:poly(3-hydroxybutyrate) depolymerase
MQVTRCSALVAMCCAGSVALGAAGCAGSDTSGKTKSASNASKPASANGTSAAMGSGGAKVQLGTAGMSAAAGKGGTAASSSGPSQDKLPTAQGECPTFAQDGDYTFNVQGGRQVMIWVDASKAAASSSGGPFIFYWHGTSSSPAFEVAAGLGQATLDDVKSQGGLVAGFYSTMNHPDKGKCDECKSNTGNGVWFTEDFNLADEVLACAIKQLHIDTRRIHVSGMSAGGLQTAAMLYARSNYLASAAPYSGGAWFAGTPQDPSNQVAAMLFHGTFAKDIVTLHFYATSKIVFDDVKMRGGFAIDCNHGGGHMIPPDGGPAVWKFFQAHPYGTNPSPWATKLPADLPPYCSLNFTEEPGAGGPFG